MSHHRAPSSREAGSVPVLASAAGPVPFLPGVRELLAAVLDAIDIPFPATVGDGERYQTILLERAMHARITLARVLEPPGRLPLDLAFEVSYLRRKLAENPPTGYQVWQRNTAAVPPVPQGKRNTPADHEATS